MNASSKPKVIVAMSGGVDSSVTAALLKEKGYQVIGINLRLWRISDDDSNATADRIESTDSAQRVADILGIQFIEVGAREKFRKLVIKYFIDGYLSGMTPNPCVKCNRWLKWDILFQQAEQFEAEYIATGHYARIQQMQGGTYELLRACDVRKDQSYVLCYLTQNLLSQTILPLGEYCKDEIRDLARQFNLPVAERPDSQDLCFLEDMDYRTFLYRYAPEVVNPGVIKNRNGEIIGQHQGLALYTIGQRKGIGIAAAEPLYVLEKDINRNTLIVGHADELGRTELLATNLNWISGQCPEEPIEIQVKIRYSSPSLHATLLMGKNNSAKIIFEKPLRDITPGQFAVFYDENVVLGGGEIVR
ncbi:MAG: tRNA 2-thiouridine(34) synthase MnmA [Anaerolineaceae bacterium]|nr:tRNA 2-thiouridine(34) synthase MnmA [Anaerolineaceae bacterium]